MNTKQNAASICINAAEETIRCLLQEVADGSAEQLDVATIPHYVEQMMIGGEMVGQMLSEMHATHQMRWQCIKFLCTQWGFRRSDAIVACYFRGC